jgi:hypothetical protein
MEPSTSSAVLNAKRPSPTGRYRLKPVSCDHWPAGCQVTRTAVTEPAASGLEVAALGDPELGLRALDEPSVVAGRAGHGRRVEQTPGVGVQCFEVLGLAGVDGQCRQERLAGARGVDEAAERESLPSSVRTLVNGRPPSWRNCRCRTRAWAQNDVERDGPMRGATSGRADPRCHPKNPGCFPAVAP